MTNSSQQKRAAQKMREQLAQRPDGDLVVSVPLVGSLTWKCNNEREFSFTFTPDRATITVVQFVGGETTKRQLNPGENLRSPFRAADVHREWTVTYRHKPEMISAGISVLPAVSGGACFIRESTLQLIRAPS